MRKTSTKGFLRASIFLTFFCGGVSAVESQTHRAKQINTEGSRQIHLDFHTSEKIDDIAVKFNKEQFQKALITGRVNAINIFGKGHHGWSYYDTKVGKRHPNLDFDLLKAQIEACREINVSPRVYFTVGYSDWEAKAYPSWVQLDKDGKSEFEKRTEDLKPGERLPGVWYYLEPSFDYAESIYQQIEELAKNYDLDGFWLDIFAIQKENYNEASLADYKKRGIDVNDLAAVQARTREKYQEFFDRINAIVKKHQPKASVFFNGTTAEFNSEQLADFKYRMFDANTKFDLEDLPTAWGGYDIFPWRSKYFSNLEKDIVAMSGKFHTAWGEFGGFKSKEALKYETASMVAYGANINIGDQLHPSGEMDMSTYENIGHAFDYVQKIENYGIGADHVANTGLYVGGNKAALEGTVAMLLEGQVNFDVVNHHKDWSQFEVIVLTSDPILASDHRRLKSYLADGGKVLAMHKSVLKDGAFIINTGARFDSEAAYDNDYTLVGEDLGLDMVASPFLNYLPAIKVVPNPKTKVLAHIHEPYFSRRKAHFSSHKNTPFTLEKAEHPAVIATNNVVYFSHPLDLQYHQYGMKLHRQLFLNGLSRLRESPYVAVKLPSQGRINLLHQEDQQRYVLHLLYASPIQRGNVRVIEDLPELRNISVSFSAPNGREVSDLRVIPGGAKLAVRKKEGRYHATLPSLNMHAALVYSYE